MAEYLGVDPTVMPYVIDDLVAAGLVERHEDPADRRRRVVGVTEAGRERYRILTWEVQSAEAAFFDTIPGGDREVFVQILSQLALSGRDAPQAARNH